MERWCHCENYTCPEMTQKNEKGAPSFQDLKQTYLNMSEDTANVHYVLFKARDAINDHSLELVTSNDRSEEKGQ